MQTKFILFFLLICASISFAQTNPYPHLSIRDLQFQPQDSLLAGTQSSPYLGDTVQVTGVVMVSTLVEPTFDRRPLMWAGSRWQTYLRDTSFSDEWGGLNVIQNDTTGPNQNSLMDLLDSTMIVTITGVVAEFGVQTQLNVLTEYPVQFLGNEPNRGEPIEITINQLNIGTPPADTILSGEKYEGMYVIIRNVITSDRNTSNGTFAINDGNGNQIFIHDQSGYFTRRAHQLRTFDPPVDGTTIQYIRGVVGHFNNPNRYVLRPMYPDDLLIGQSPPAISSIRRDIGIVTPNQPVTISARIFDLDQGGSVTGAKVKYRVNGGERVEVNMTENVSDTTWSATIPGVPVDSAVVDYYIWAQDNDGMISTNPIDTTRNFFYLVLNRDITIQDVQYSPFGTGFSGYNGFYVTVSGVVTADTTDLRGDGGSIGKRVYIQNGQGPWSGIWIFGLEADALLRGQDVTVNGRVIENFNHTRIDSITTLVVNPSGNPLPLPELVSTSDIGGKSKGTISAEQWEGVLIEFEDVTVTDDNADGNSGPGGGGNSNFGEILVADISTNNVRVELQEGNHEYHNLWTAGLDTLPGNVRILEGDSFDNLRGVLFFSFGNYKLVPRKSDDFVGYTTDVEYINNSVVDSYNLNQNYPNPFNPVTSIQYSIPEAGFVQIKIYNILGQEVASLVNLEQSSGSYKVIFDATKLSSGVYLYQINVNNYQQTKKMMLMK
ncbi:MAG: T9SS type A sorting domain-containing protein [Ignavibacterium sp.]|nr:T9SS type A sorting domain-containing protein [Ignavibacterium sp.]